MAEQDTLLASIADNVADSFFDDGASSNNVITPPEEQEGKTEDKKEEKTPEIKNEGITSPLEVISADDLIGDILEKQKDEPIFVNETPKEPEKKPQEAKPAEPDFNFLLEDNLLFGFEDDSPIKSKKDALELIKANKEHWVSEAKKEALVEYEGALPQEVKLIMDYAKNGGQDFKTLFKLIGQNQEIREYDLTKPEDQRSIIRSYYETQGWSEDEIEEELINLVEGERLEGQSKKLKPKLEKYHQERLAEQEEEQKLIDEQREKARQFFTQNVVDTLKKGQLGDLKLSNEEAQDIYSALVNERYQSFSGKTNRLGALLDKIQYVEPDYALLAEVTLLLSNPDEYRRKIREGIETKVAANTVKKIKIEQDKQKIGSNHNPEKETKKLPRLNQGFLNPFNK